MWNTHASVGLCQTLFYVPAIFAASYLFYVRHTIKPLVQWVVLLIFSIVRFGGGISLILYTQQPNDVGRIIATTIFEGAGAIPLMVTVILHLLLIKAIDFPADRHFKWVIVCTRLIFLVGIGLLVGGSCLIGNYKEPDSVATGLKLAKAGYIIITFVLVLTATWISILWFLLEKLTSNSRKVLVAITSSLPFLLVRLIYALFTVFSTNAKWSPLTGSVGLFVVMHSLMEYIVVIILIVAGLRLDHSSLPRKEATKRSRRGRAKNGDIV